MRSTADIAIDEARLGSRLRGNDEVGVERTGLIVAVRTRYRGDALLIGLIRNYG